RDRYGFRCESQHVSLEDYKAWQKRYEEHLVRRHYKWDTLLNETSQANAVRRNGSDIEFPARSAKLQRYIRKGIPPEYRGQAWFHYANGHACLRAHPGLYHRLAEQACRLCSDGNNDLIERDLHRTFPDNIHFKPDGYTRTGQTANATAFQEEPPMIASLRRVLQAFALYRPQVGYCQSLNFIAALFLLFMPEERAFWMVVITTTDYLPHVHDANLEGANVDQAVLMLAVRECLPSIWSRLGQGFETPSSPHPTTPHEIIGKLPPITLVTAAWFMSAFIGILPIETTLRVWDCLFYEGSKVLFRIALTILKQGERSILAVSDPIEIFQVVQTLPRQMIDAGALMEACFKRRNGVGHLSQKEVDARRQKVAAIRG
ncbi:rab-GTPase-TBC domain-containing protein, partial [Protomyces lactucae-debilis]